MTPVATLMMNPRAEPNFFRAVPLVEASKDYHHQDTANVDDLSDLFSVIEQEQTTNDACAVDELMSEWFKNCEEAAIEVDEDDAIVVDEITDMFDMLEGNEDLVLDAETEDDAAGLVDEIAELFDSLEDAATKADADVVDDVSCMFDALVQDAKDAEDSTVVDELSRLFDAEVEKTTTTAPVYDCRVPVAATGVKIDSRIPQLGQLPAYTSYRLPLVGNFVCGPPIAVKELTREDRVGRWKEKKRNRTNMAAPKVVFESRQQVAAKRRRINGRFAGLETQFVSVSAFHSTE
ncbi:hypothetical protein DYB26_010076 [Aphanomyces astaci]|uniref:CCT domain-containing protein n=1 Tax=Aphanomyces astaci TaxID=112090 RepID=A0A397C421_APHAT|nr:hypothetical protein DYB38_004138 [Aphanomyces astaci]RHY84647.1 hypothetical protein DYB31_006995 [Aphanomyces astaci]RHZ30536.1 hypothetical protein DYB26_010076 [Aphanomyces astaci]